MHAISNTTQIDVHNTLPIGPIHIGKIGHWQANSCIVDEDVEPTFTEFQGRSYSSLNIFFNRYITMTVDSTFASFLNIFDQGGSFNDLLAIRNNDVGSFCCKGKSYSTSNSCSRTNYQCSSIF